MEIYSSSKTSAFNTSESFINKNLECNFSKAEVGMHFGQTLLPSPFLLSPSLSTACLKVTDADRKPLLFLCNAVRELTCLSSLPLSRITLLGNPTEELQILTTKLALIVSYFILVQLGSPPPAPTPPPCLPVISPAWSSQLSPLFPPLLLFPTWQNSLTEFWVAGIDQTSIQMLLSKMAPS